MEGCLAPLQIRFDLILFLVGHHRELQTKCEHNLTNWITGGPNTGAPHPPQRLGPALPRPLTHDHDVEVKARLHGLLPHLLDDGVDADVAQQGPAAAAAAAAGGPLGAPSLGETPTAMTPDAAVSHPMAGPHVAGGVAGGVADPVAADHDGDGAGGRAAGPQALGGEGVGR